MQWRSKADEALAGQTGDAGHVLNAAEIADMLCTWSGNTLLRVQGADGRAVWVWRGVGDISGLVCCAVAPWGSGWDVDAVAGFEVFGVNPPEDWITKARAALAAKDWTKRETVWSDASIWAVALFAVEGKPRSRKTKLCKVAKVEAGQLVEVFTEDGLPPVAVSRLGAVRWIPQDTYTQGYEVMWETGQTEARAYLWHVVKARQAMGLGKKSKAAKKAIDVAD